MSILHRTHTFSALVPRYVSRFRCLGTECEDTCCFGWNIDVDKKTFKAYRQSPDPVLKARTTEHIKRQEGEAGQESYARIELDAATRECPLMDGRLCGVQKTLGSSYLSHTCFTFPRHSRRFGGQHEQTLVLSCPEAARQALLEPDAFEFIEESITVRNDTVMNIGSRHGMSLELMNEVRIFCLQLMRTEGLALWQKLAVLGVFCESLTNNLQQAGDAGVRALLDEFATLVEQGLVQGALDGVFPNHTAQATVFSVLWQVKHNVALGSPVQNKVFASIAEGLGADPSTGDAAPERLIECYVRGVQRLPAALQAAPYLLDHYILNEMFGDLFPFGGSTPYENYLQLISRFGLLRLMLAAQCNKENILPDAQELVQTVHVYCRRFQHDTKFAAQVNFALAKNGWGKLEQIFAFLRA